MSVRIARVAVAAPLHSLFDYQIPAGSDVAVGSRVRVSFGRSRPIGVVTAVVGRSEWLCLPRLVASLTSADEFHSVKNTLTFFDCSQRLTK